MGISLIILVVSGLAGLAVPASMPRRGISEAERQLLNLDLPLLFVSFGVALTAVALSASGKHRLAGFTGILSLVIINIAGLLSGQFGTDGGSLPVTLLVTAPIAIVVAARETRQRGLERSRLSSGASEAQGA